MKNEGIDEEREVYRNVNETTEEIANVFRDIGGLHLAMGYDLCRVAILPLCQKCIQKIRAVFKVPVEARTRDPHAVG